MGELLNWQSILIYIVNVLIMFFFLKWILHKPISKFLKKREDAVSEQLDNAQKAEQDAYELKAQYEKQISLAEQQSAEIIENSRKSASEQAEEIVSRAKAESQYLLERAHKEIEKEKMIAQEEMRTQITDMAMRISSKILDREISAKDNEKIIKEFFEKVG